MNKPIEDLNEFFECLENIFNSSSLANGGYDVQAIEPPVALNIEPCGNPEENPKDFVQMLEEMDGLKGNKYVQTATQFMPVIISVEKSLLPYLEGGSPEMVLILRNVAFIGFGLASFAELVILTPIIEKDFSSSATVKHLLQDTLEYTNTRIQSNHQRFSEIEDMIKMAKIQEFEANSKKNNILLIKLHEMIRVCRIDISECMQKMKELYTKIEFTMTSFSIQMKRYALAAAGLGTMTVAGIITALVATGGFVSVAGVMAGASGIVSGGLSYRAKQCGDYKHDFIAMKNKCDALLGDVKRLQEKLELHVSE